VLVQRRRKKSPELISDHRSREQDPADDRSIQNDLERRAGMRINEAAVLQVRLDRLGEQPDEIEALLREKDERRDHSNEDRAGYPEEALSQLLEMIEKRHLRVRRHPRLRHGISPSRAAAHVRALLHRTTGTFV
jgi:hypothetical protein